MKLTPGGPRYYYLIPGFVIRKLFHCLSADFEEKTQTTFCQIFQKKITFLYRLIFWYSWVILERNLHE